MRGDHWRIFLVLPGVNLDPVPPLYLITVHYNGNATIQSASTSRRIRVESERTGLERSPSQSRLSCPEMVPVPLAI